MTAALLQALPDFAGDFVVALGTNLTLAGEALVLGLPAGLALGLARLPSAAPTGSLRLWSCLRRGVERAAHGVVALLRAAPTFVVMYVLLNAMPADWAISAPAAVAAALAVYAAAYVADNLLATLVDRRAGVRGGALLFLMGLARLYFVMVLSSGFCAGVGVTEATAVTLRTLEQLPTLGDRLWLMAGVVSVFVVIRVAVYAAIGGAHRLVLQRMAR